MRVVLRDQKRSLKRLMGRMLVKQLPKLPFLTLAATLLSAGSVYALERAAPMQLAQAGPDDEKGGPPDKQGGPRERGGGEGAPRERGGGDDAPRGRDRGGPEGGEPPAARQKRDDDGDRPARPQREKAADDDGPAERPARPARDKDDAPRERKAPAPAAQDDDGPATKKARPPKDEAEPKSPPAEKAPEPKAEPKPERKAPEPKPEAQPESKAPEPKAPEPKATEPKGEPKGGEPAIVEPKAAPRGKDDPDSKPGARPDPKADSAPAAPAPKGPDGEGPRKSPESGLPPARDGKAAEPAGRGAGAVAAPEVKDLKELKEERKERSEDGGKRVVIEEPDKRVIVKEGGKAIIRADETERFRRLGGDTRREKRNGLDISINVRPGGIEIYTESDDRGRPLRRYRRDRDGREVILFDNRDYYRRHRDGSFVDAIIDLPPPRLSIPRDDYIVDYEEASDVDVYEALSAPPVEELDRTYSLEEVRRSPTLRDRMRRVDLDAINFEFGAWEVTSDQYPALERIAKAMKRVIDKNPNEVFMIEGHTDAVGSDEDNLSLSDRRAESVSIILTEEFGVAPENMTTQGYGEQYLKVNSQAAERQNRRVAVRRITPLLSRGN